MIRNVQRFCRRSKFAKNVTLRWGHLTNEEKRAVREHYGYLERYYVRMYYHELRDEFLELLPVRDDGGVYDNLAGPLLTPLDNHHEEIVDATYSTLRVRLPFSKPPPW